MSIILTLACVLFSTSLGGLAGMAMAVDLPPEILADQYLLEATDALEQGNGQTALAAFEKIEALETEFPEELEFFYGQLLVEHGTTEADVSKGTGLLKQYVLNLEKGAKEYKLTLRLLTLAGTRIKQIAAERRRRAAEAERRRQAAEAERRRQAAEAEQRRQAAEAEQRRQAAEAEQRRQAAEAERQRIAAYREWLSATFTQQMVAVQGGTFEMGCTKEQEGDCSSKEKPVHLVRVRSFEIGKYEVTQELWEAVMGGSPSDFQGCAQCPVNYVRWEEVQEFLEQLNRLTGEQYRLPTEAEWEYAARGGEQSQGYKYAGSHTAGRVGWYKGNSGRKPHPVGQKESNELGLYDMSGNVEEWVQDCWNATYEEAPRDGSAWENGDCSQHMVRGGSWVSGPRTLRSAYRLANGPVGRFDNGLRVARTLTP